MISTRNVASEGYQDEFIEISLTTPDHFLIVQETLTRIGVLGKDNAVYQSCHILHKRGKYYIVHFKRMFVLDGKEAFLSPDDISREVKIAKLLEDWNLIKINTPILEDSHSNSISVTVVPFKDKKKFKLVPKYTIGKRGS